MVYGDVLTNRGLVAGVCEVFGGLVLMIVELRVWFSIWIWERFLTKQFLE